MTMIFGTLTRRLGQWQRIRRDIRRLEGLDDRLLDDMGIPRETISRRLRGQAAMNSAAPETPRGCSGRRPEHVAQRGLGRFDAGKDLTVDAEGIELDGKEAEAGAVDDEHALGLAIDIDGYRSGAMWLIKNCMLHGRTSIGTSWVTAGVLAEL
ncbi:MAG: DUF1127 domain-containing protein [Devosia sp.]|nr:DUF1127 domain-containing protein [Devosia sp.]